MNQLESNFDKPEMLRFRQKSLTLRRARQKVPEAFLLQDHRPGSRGTSSFRSIIMGHPPSLAMEIAFAGLAQSGDAELGDLDSNAGYLFGKQPHG